MAAHQFMSQQDATRLKNVYDKWLWFEKMPTWYDVTGMREGYWTREMQHAMAMKEELLDSGAPGGTILQYDIAITAWRLWIDHRAYEHPSRHKSPLTSPYGEEMLWPSLTQWRAAVAKYYK